MATLPGDIHVEDLLSCGRFNPPDGCIGDEAIDPDNPILEDKAQHRHYIPLVKQGSAVAASSERSVCYIAHLNGEVKEIRVAVVVAALLGATVTVDVKKNDATILTSIITITNADTAYSFQTAGLDADDKLFDTGDFFETVVVATAGGGTLPKGLFVDMVVLEDGEG